MFLTAQEASDSTKKALRKNERYPRTELDDVTDLIEIAIRKGLYHLEIDDELQRDTVAILLKHGYLVSVIREGPYVSHITSWSK